MADKNLVQIPGSEIPTDGAALNVANRLYIDSTGSQDLDDITSGKWAWVAKGISEITPSWQEKSQKTAYYDGDGHDDTEVTGKSLQLAIKGVRYTGDPAQDYVNFKQYGMGNSVKTRALWINNGVPVVSVCTLTAIVTTGGAADAQQNVSFTIAFDGKPMTVDGQLKMDETEQKRVFKANITAGGRNPWVTYNSDGSNTAQGSHASGSTPATSTTGSDHTTD